MSVNRLLGRVFASGVVVLSVAAPCLCSAQNGEYIFHAPQVELVFDGVSGVGSGTLELAIEQDPSSPGYPTETDGFSMGIGYAGDFVTLVSAEPIGVLAAVNDGDGPEFFGDNLDPTGGPGFTVGVVYTLCCDEIQFFSPEPVIALGFETIPANLVGTFTDIPVPLQWSNDIGDPPVWNTVVEVGTFYPDFVDGELLLVPLAGPVFIRGDANGDGAFTGIVDGLSILAWNFQSGPPPPCLVAADADGDDVLSGLVDALYIFAHQFAGGPPPPAPFPFCDQPDSTLLECEVTPCP